MACVSVQNIVEKNMLLLAFGYRKPPIGRGSPKQAGRPDFRQCSLSVGRRGGGGGRIERTFAATRRKRQGNERPRKREANKRTMENGHARTIANRGRRVRISPPRAGAAIFVPAPARSSGRYRRNWSGSSPISPPKAR